MKQNTLSPDLLSSLFRQLHGLLHAGARPEEAAALLQKEGAQLDPLLAQLRQPGRFSDACEKSGLFPDYAVQTLALGETAGRLEEALDALAQYYRRQAQLNERLKSALVRPAALLLLMCAVLAVLVFAVMPVFTGVYESLTGSLVGSSYGYVTAAVWIARVCLCLTGLACVLALVLAACARVPGLRRRMSPLLERLPLARGAVYSLALSRLCSALATLLRSGMDPAGALEAAARLNTHRALKQKLSSCASALAGGKGLAQALAEEELFSPMQSWILTSSAAGGTLAEALADLAQRTQEEGEARINALLDAVEPFFTILLTVSVALSLLSALLPLVGILGAIG